MSPTGHRGSRSSASTAMRASSSLCAWSGGWAAAAAAGLAPRRPCPGRRAALLLRDDPQERLLVGRAQELGRRGVEVADGDREQLAATAVVCDRLRGEPARAHGAALAQPHEAVA